CLVVFYLFLLFINLLCFFFCFVFFFFFLFFIFFFFFSSRRRHTRSKRDWSSDVCSSDLPNLGAHGVAKCPRRLTQVLGAIEHDRGNHLANRSIAVDHRQHRVTRFHRDGESRGDRKSVV